MHPDPAASDPGPRGGMNLMRLPRWPKRLPLRILTIVVLVLAGTVAILLVASARGVRMSADTVVSLSPEQTWAFFNDPNNLAKWDRSVARVEVTSPPPYGVGTTLDTISPERNGQVTRSSYRISEVVPGQRTRADLIDSAQFQRAQWTTSIEPVDTGTRIVSEIEFSPKPQYFFLTPVLWLSQNNLETDMRYLHDALEAYGRDRQT